ncbi:FHA domain-containing protein FhaB/FipA [Acidipropionibacterium virtanenii]|uniref:FHA domain-containing protein FhaB n=1 Tax=Acidipropionibacterium virtanenii TaxID=2057246 RepID=A0A344UX78_9ACTN|nr:FHA domain-containing protein [Acidipropionibacterium virtanenii]AXE39876.1 FHA domain-containing protein FhaB [Acidipropionibacterium virtanenii]
MSEFLVSVLRIAYLALLWVLILLVARTVRTDMFGRRVVARTGAPAAGSAPPRLDRKSRRRAAGREAIPGALRIISGSRAGLVIPMNDRILVGRGGDSNLPIEDDYASTHHAEFTQGVDGAWFVEDLRSTNGTYVNGQRIEDPTRLSIGDEVRIGRTTMAVEADGRG